MTISALPLFWHQKCYQQNMEQDLVSAKCLGERGGAGEGEDERGRDQADNGHSLWKPLPQVT